MLPSIWQLEITTGVLWPDLGSPVWERHWQSGATPVKDHGDDEQAGACDIQGKAEKMFNPNERRQMWYSEDYCCWWLSDAGCRADGAELFLGKHSGRTRGWDQKLEHGNSIPIPMTVVSDRKGCLDRLWNLYPSKLNWPQPPLWFIWTYNE